MKNPNKMLNKIIPVIKTDKGLLYEIIGMKGLYEIKNKDGDRLIFKRVK